MTRRRKAVVAILGAFLVAFVLVIVLFDWSWFKAPIEQLASSQLERRVEIGGDIDGEVALTPRFWVEDVRIANADWGSRPHMLTLELLTFEIDLLELIGGRVVLPMVALRAPDVLVERDGDGRLNWQVGGEEEPTGQRPAIGEISVRNARIAYRGAGTEREVVATLETLSGTGGMASGPIKLRGSGALADLPLKLELAAGALNEIEGGGEPYPVDVALDVGDTSAALQGSIQEPTSFEAVDLSIRLESPNPTPVLAAAGFGQAPAPPLSLAGRFVHERQVWSVLDLRARVGESTLAGRAGVDLGKDPLLVKADLSSERLDVQALQELYERFVPATARDEDQAADPVWSPEGGLNVDLLPDLQLDVALDAREVTAEDLYLGELHLDGTLRDKMPRLQLSAQGRYQGEPLQIEATAGTDLLKPGPYRLDGRLELGANAATLSGQMSEPLALAGLDVAFDLESPRPTTLFELLSLPAPQIPGLMLAGRLEHDDALWQLHDFTANLGDSDIAGSLTLDLRGETPRLSADLRSETVTVADLEQLRGPRAEAAAEEVAEEVAKEAPEEEAPEETEEEQVAEEAAEALITLEGVNRSLLPDWQATVDYTIGRLSGPDLEIEDAELHARLRDQIVVAAISGQGAFEGEPVRVDLQLGRADGAAAGDGSYPIEAHLEAGETTADLEAQLAEPMHFGEATARFELTSPDPGRWLALADLPASEIPPLRAMAELSREGDRWRLPDAYLEVGESNLFGTAMLDLTQERPRLEANLQSNRLLVEDLIRAQEAAEEEAAPKEPGPAASAGTGLERLPEADANVTLEAEYVRLPQDVVLEPLRAELQLRDQIAVLDLSGEGKYGLSPLTIDAHVGTPENLSDPSARYPVEVRLESDVTAAHASGSVGDPRTFTQLDVDVSLAGQNLEQLGTILRLGLPRTPPYRLAGNLVREAARWRLGTLEGRIGDSDIQGTATVDLGAERPTIVAELSSDRLDFDDLGTLVGAPPAAAGEETASEAQERQAAREATTPGVLPDDEFDLPEMRSSDARVRYEAQEVQARQVPLERVTLGLRLEDGVLTIDPLRFDVSQGTLASSMRLDAREDPLDAQIDLSVRELDLSVLLQQFDIDLPQFEGEERGRGTMSGRAKLEARGNSVAALAGSLDGRLAIILEGGRINAALVEAAGLDLAELAGLLVAGGEEGQDMVPIRCLVADVPISQGTARLDPLVLDTTDSTVVGIGTIDLDKEALDLRFAASPKDVSPLSANVPVQVSGSLSDIDILPRAEEILDKGFIDLGLVEDANCQALIEEVRQKLAEEDDEAPQEP